MTALPVPYNWTFVAGVMLAARLGARLHLSSSVPHVLDDAAAAAPAADRVIVLANPVVLDQAAHLWGLPANIMIDSGGAPLGTSAITEYRSHGIDIREGYGLTETASVTHFDSAATAASLGTVGTPMPSVQATINLQDGRPVIDLTSPAIGVPLDPCEPHTPNRLHTTDLGKLDEFQRLRLLGRSDDQPIAGYWPRDTLDLLGPVLGRRCAQIRHTASDEVAITLLTPALPHTALAIIERVAEALDLPRNQIALTHQTGPLLPTLKLPNRRPGRPPAARTPSGQGWWNA